MKVWEALKMQLMLNKQEERESDPACNHHSTAAKRCHIDKAKMQVKSEIAQHLVGKLDFNFVKLHLLNRFSDPIHQFGNHVPTNL